MADLGRRSNDRHSFGIRRYWGFVARSDIPRTELGSKRGHRIQSFDQHVVFRDERRSLLERSPLDGKRKVRQFFRFDQRARLQKHGRTQSRQSHEFVQLSLYRKATRHPESMVRCRSQFVAEFHEQPQRAGARFALHSRTAVPIRVVRRDLCSGCRRIQYRLAFCS